MAQFRDRPYSQFNFQVEIDDIDLKGGFQEISGLGLEITVSEYRPGNYAFNAPMKITAMHKVPDVTLKRGVLGAKEFYEWLNSVKLGSQDERQTMVITLLDEARDEVVKWTLREVRPIKYTGPAFNGKGTDVAVEELVLACELIEFDSD
jgi:phage tail-like protein